MGPTSEVRRGKGRRGKGRRGKWDGRKGGERKKRERERRDSGGRMGWCGVTLELAALGDTVLL